MDAVELPLPPAISVSKLMGSEGFVGGAGVTVGGVEAERVSVLANSSIDACSSFRNKKDKKCAVTASELGFWSSVPNSGPCKHENQISSFNNEDTPEDLSCGSKNISSPVIPNIDSDQLRRKSGKTVRSSNSCGKRSRMATMEISKSEHGADTVKEKSQTAKQKNNLNGKRGDKRNGKVPKNKYDSFSLRNGLISLGSAAGGSNILGYGSKADTVDATMQLDELLLNDLLDGSYKCPTIPKDKGKELANCNENILHSVKKACSVLWHRKPIQPPNYAEIGINNDGKASTGLVSSSTLANGNIIDKGDISTVDRSSCNEVKPPADVLDCPLYQPKEILERLSLSLPKDLESLLLDVPKPVSSSRNNPDPRLGKVVFGRRGLSSFSWSHGHCKSSSDAVKLSTSRSGCQARWAKVENNLNTPPVYSGFDLKLETLIYDHKLVPSRGPNSLPLDSENVPSSSMSLAGCEKGSVPGEWCLDSSSPSDENSPILLAAAKTLYEIASKHNPTPNKLFQKPIEACKFKSNEKPESKSPPLDNSKKMVMMMEKNWSTPRSIKLPLNTAVSESKLYNANVRKKQRLVNEENRESQEKPRTFMGMDWSRSGK